MTRHAITVGLAVSYIYMYLYIRTDVYAGFICIYIKCTGTFIDIYIYLCNTIYIIYNILYMIYIHYIYILYVYAYKCMKL